MYNFIFHVVGKMGKNTDKINTNLPHQVSSPEPMAMEKTDTRLANRTNILRRGAPTMLNMYCERANVL